MVAQWTHPCGNKTNRPARISQTGAPTSWQQNQLSAGRNQTIKKYNSNNKVARFNPPRHCRYSPNRPEKLLVWSARLRSKVRPAVLGIIFMLVTSRLRSLSPHLCCLIFVWQDYVLTHLSCPILILTVERQFMHLIGRFLNGSEHVLSTANPGCVFDMVDARRCSTKILLVATTASATTVCL